VGGWRRIYRKYRPKYLVRAILRAARAIRSRDCSGPDLVRAHDRGANYHSVNSTVLVSYLVSPSPNPRSPPPPPNPPPLPTPRAIVRPSSIPRRNGGTSRRARGLPPPPPLPTRISGIAPRGKKGSLK